MAFATEALDAIVEVVSDVQRAVCPERHARWAEELAIAAAATPQGGDQRPVGPIHLDPVVAEVSHVDPPAADGDRHAERCTQITHAATRRAPGGHGAAIGTKALHAI